jgi:hypothetical protein
VTCPAGIRILPELLRNLISWAHEVDEYPGSISSGMRLDSACEAWLQERKQQRKESIESQRKAVTP